MLKRIYPIFIFILVSIYVNAGNIDKQTARKVAEGFIRTQINAGITGIQTSDTDFTVSRNGENVYYIINLQPQGFIIVPAYDAAPPVLGYSTGNNYSPDNQPESFSAWMDGYAKIISQLIETNLEANEGNKAHWDALISNSSFKSTATLTTVGPLLPCIWNQGSPYNYLCPSDPTGPGGHVYSGCVATAMSQVMYYWRYPQQGYGSHGYTWNPYGYLYADFGNTTYKWEEMLLSTTTQNFEMAQLQSHLGISVNMMYSGNGSGAYSDDAAEALKTYFGYDQSLELVYRDNYSYDDWKSMLWAQIDAGQPMYYHGFGTGGHAFNVDGYQDTSYFHFNWGWGGSYNGYFHLFNLNPGGNSFTEGQGAIINFIPESNNNVVQCGSVDTLTMLEGSMEDGSGPVSPYFDSSTCSWLILPGDTLDNIKLTFHRFDLEDGKDFIFVYDGTNTDASLIGSYTGSNIPTNVIAYSGSMFVQFVTDGNGTSNGWFATYKAKQATFCSSNTTHITDKSGSISDGSGSFDYRNKTICKYKLEPTDAKSLNITFTEFNTAGESDYLEIYDLETQILLYKLYGQTIPGTLYINTGKLYIIFVTDQQNTGTGWNFIYESSEFTGTNESMKGIEASVFPNPAQNQIGVRYSAQNEKHTIELLSTDGTILYQENSIAWTGNEIKNIDVSTFARGLYILRISSGKGTVYRKVVLN
jgi:hypothetical protein